MPTVSLRTLANGARQFVVHDAFEMTWCWSGSYWSKLTPRQTVMSSPLAGAEMMTFFAPPLSMCFDAFSRSVKRPVDSMTTSTPRSLHGRFAGSRLGEDLQLVAVDARPSPVASTVPGYGPRIESYLRR